MAGEHVTTRTITTEIEHLDFEFEPPCEERPCMKAPRAAELVAFVRCPGCKKEQTTLICRGCWAWLLSMPAFECTFCDYYLGPAASFVRIRPLKRS